MDVTLRQPDATPSETDPILVLLARIAVRMLTEQHDPSEGNAPTPHEARGELGPEDS